MAVYLVVVGDARRVGARRHEGAGDGSAGDLGGGRKRERGLDVGDVSLGDEAALGARVGGELLLVEALQRGERVSRGHAANRGRVALEEREVVEGGSLGVLDLSLEARDAGEPADGGLGAGAGLVGGVEPVPVGLEARKPQDRLVERR